MDTNQGKASSFDNERVTRKQKEANDFKWYKEKADSYDNTSGGGYFGFGEVSEEKRMQVSYDLFNNILDVTELEYVCKPFGAETGELPATMSNKDITSNRIKSVIGKELNMPFNYNMLAVNSEATTRKEAAETDKIKEYVVAQIMRPIQQQTELKYQQELSGELTPQQRQQIEASIAEETQAMTPPEVKKYMKRQHQDPAEVQGQQILNYLVREQGVKRKFNNGFKHAALSAYEIYFVGLINNKPLLKVINPMRYTYGKNPNLEFLEDAEWCVVDYPMTKSEVVRSFDLTNSEIDEVYSMIGQNYTQNYVDNMFSNTSTREDEWDTITVKHIQFNGLRKVGWLDYMDENEEIQTKMLVDEEYKLNREAGDIYIQWEWIPEAYEVWKIGPNIYKNMGPVKGQIKTKDNLKDTPKKSYYGAVYDNTNSEPTSIMDRMKGYQYLYNIIWYRIELLTASDEGKKVLMNILGVPDSQGMDMKTWQYYAKSTPYIWYNPEEEGMTSGDVNTVAKVLDLSLASDIGKYLNMASVIEQQCGKSVGITDPVLGETAVSERVSNNQQNLIQTSYILEPYYYLHNEVKKNALQALLDVARIGYLNSDVEVLHNVLDDMSREMIYLDRELLASSVLGLFIEDGVAAEKLREQVQGLAQAALQNQKVELSDVLKVLREDSIQEASETLEVAEETRIEREQAQAEAERNFKAEEADKERQEKVVDHKRKIELIVVKSEEDRKTQIQKQAILSAGFNEDKDFDSDGQLDVLEIAKNGVDAQIAIRKEDREDRLADAKIESDKENLKLKAKEVANKKVASK
jgi:hypothetical protein